MNKKGKKYCTWVVSWLLHENKVNEQVQNDIICCKTNQNQSIFNHRCWVSSIPNLFYMKMLVNFIENEFWWPKKILRKKEKLWNWNDLKTWYIYIYKSIFEGMYEELRGWKHVAYGIAWPRWPCMGAEVGLGRWRLEVCGTLMWRIEGAFLSCRVHGAFICCSWTGTTPHSQGSSTTFQLDLHKFLSQNLTCRNAIPPRQSSSVVPTVFA